MFPAFLLRLHIVRLGSQQGRVIAIQVRQETTPVILEIIVDCIVVELEILPQRFLCHFLFFTF